MQDAIIKGNGNSRYLKTVAAALSLYPTYEDFLQALVAGNFPIDLNGINEAGWTQQGTPLNKANLLPDTLATSLGLPTTATVADALDALKTLNDDTNDAIEEAIEWELVSSKVLDTDIPHSSSGHGLSLAEIGSVVAQKDYSELRLEVYGTVTAPAVPPSVNYLSINVGSSSVEAPYAISSVPGGALSNAFVSADIVLPKLREQVEGTVTKVEYRHSMFSSEPKIALRSDNSASGVECMVYVKYQSKSGNSADVNLTINVYGRNL